MAARKVHYVYAIFEGVVPVYVGKGSGRRLKNQVRKFSLPGEILEEFDCERKAYASERVWIKKLRPGINVHPGGNGGRLKKVIRRRDKLQIEIEKDSRRYAAKLLLACNAASPGSVDSSKVGQIRQVAYGHWA